MGSGSVFGNGGRVRVNQVCCHMCIYRDLIAVIMFASCPFYCSCSCFIFLTEIFALHFTCASSQSSAFEISRDALGKPKRECMGARMHDSKYARDLSYFCNLFQVN